MSSGHVLPDGAAVAFDCVQPGLLFELRVLSGLHEGAALPLFGERWSIGAHQDADLELYDPGVEARHAHLHCMDGRWTVQAQEGLLQDKGGTARAQIADLAPGTAFSIGGIQLCVANTQSGWVQNLHQYLGYSVKRYLVSKAPCLLAASASGWLHSRACSY